MYWVYMYIKCIIIFYQYKCPRDRRNNFRNREKYDLNLSFSTDLNLYNGGKCFQIKDFLYLGVFILGRRYVLYQWCSGLTLVSKVQASVLLPSVLSLQSFPIGNSCLDSPSFKISKILITALLVFSDKLDYDFSKPTGREVGSMWWQFLRTPLIFL